MPSLRDSSFFFPCYPARQCRRGTGLTIRNEIIDIIAGGIDTEEKQNGPRLLS